MIDFQCSFNARFLLLVVTWFMMPGSNLLRASDFQLIPDKFIPVTVQASARDVLSETERQLTYAFPELGLRSNKMANPPCLLRLYRSPNDFRAAVSRRTRGRFDHSFAFADYRAATGHVALQPFLSDASLNVTGLPILTRYQLAHEAAHIWIGTRSAEYLRAEDWVREGIATWIAGNTMRAGGWIGDFATDPFAGTRLRRVQRLFLGRKRVHTPDDRDWYTALNSADRYALAWVWTRFLIEEGGVRPAKLWLSKPLASARDRRRTAFVEDAKSSQFDWYETGRTLEWQDGVGTQCAFENNSATAWRARRPWLPGGQLSGDCSILPNPGAVARVLLGRAADGHLEVVMNAADGVVQVFWFKSPHERPVALGQAARANLRKQRRFRFRVEYRRNRLIVVIDDHMVSSVPTGAKQPGSEWGLGVGKGSAVRWANIHLNSPTR